MKRDRKKHGKITRRRFLSLSAAAVAAAGPVGNLACAKRAGVGGRARRTLKILQWSHFVPRHDRWFDAVWVQGWGARNGVDVVVDHVTATEVAARGAAEAHSRRGHDLFLFQAPPAAHEQNVLDLRSVVEKVERRHGPMLPLARKSTLNPATGKYFAFSQSYVPDPGNYRIDLWSEIGLPNGPDSWDDLRAGGRKIREKHGAPIGIGLSQETDSNMALRALLWSFGGAEQDETGRVTLNSRATLEALEFLRALYLETMSPEVFSWDVSSNNRMLLSGRGSFIQNAISPIRTAEKEQPELARKLGLTPALRGPARRLACEHLMNCYVIWKFAANPEAAQQFLVDLVDASSSVFEESEFYNLPCFPSAVPDVARRLREDAAEPRGKYSVLASAIDWTANVGFPGYATAAIDEAFNTFVLPTMFARAARGDVSLQEALRAAQAELERIFARWRIPA